MVCKDDCDHDDSSLAPDRLLVFRPLWGARHLEVQVNCKQGKDYFVHGCKAGKEDRFDLLLILIDCSKV
jgi:hypothetical protein